MKRRNGNSSTTYVCLWEERFSAKRKLEKPYSYGEFAGRLQGASKMITHALNDNRADIKRVTAYTNEIPLAGSVTALILLS